MAGDGQDPGRRTSPNKTPAFTFVTEDTISEARSHAMKAHWQRRHRRKEEASKANHQKRPLRPLLPLARVDANANFGEAALPGDPSSSSSRSSLQDDRGRVEKRDRRDDIATQLLSGLSYALSSSRPDPFQTCPIRLTIKDQKLLHHCVFGALLVVAAAANLTDEFPGIAVHATMMLEELDDMEFNPMRDVWFPLDLSNASSFNCIMAHAAAHLGQLYSGAPLGQPTVSSDALRYKAEAVRLLRCWLAEPDHELGDDSFAAVIRLLTFERYWGNVDDWQTHRDGLQRMIDAKGGVHALGGNWRLELVVYLVSLMSRPTWFESANNLEEISPPPLSVAAPQEPPSLDIHKVRCLWLISFIQDMRTFMGCFHTRGLSSFPSTHTAVGVLRQAFLQNDSRQSLGDQMAQWEREMLQCLFSISVLMQESNSAMDGSNSLAGSISRPLDELELSLRHSAHRWSESIQTLRSILFQSLKSLAAKGELKLRYVLDMVQVLGTLSLEARQGVEKCLLNMLYGLGGSGRNTPFLVDDGWTPDSFLSLMHGY